MPAPATTPTTTAPAPAPTRKSRRVASGRICSPPLDSTSDGSGLAGPLASGITDRPLLAPTRGHERLTTPIGVTQHVAPQCQATPRTRHCSPPVEIESTN